jgi:hypothetical protein
LDRGDEISEAKICVVNQNQLGGSRLLGCCSLELGYETEALFAHTHKRTGTRRASKLHRQHWKNRIFAHTSTAKNKMGIAQISAKSKRGKPVSTKHDSKLNFSI